MTEKTPPDDFTLVNHKKRGNTFRKPQKINADHNLQLASSNTPLNITNSLRLINKAREEIAVSHYYQSVLAGLREALTTLDNPTITEIVSFGLGRIGECMVSQYQLALLLCLRERCNNVQILAYDPIFSPDEHNLLSQLDIRVATNNCEGKLKTSQTTLFYLPHCPKQLSNNLLWANWGLELYKCVIIGNSFNSILERNSKRVINESASFISVISPYMLEVALINCFRFNEIFNDMAVHVFPYDKLNLLPEEFWRDCKEPVYSSEDLEFVRANLQ